MTTVFLNAGAAGKEVSLSVLLFWLGHRPADSSGDEMLYLNVLRNGETSPTFAVNSQLNIWFDRATKKSGNILDFGLAYWPGLTSEQVSEKIGLLLAAAPEPVKEHRAGRKRRAVKVPYYHIAQTLPLGCNPEITAYLQSQGIWEIGIGQLKEVYYYVVDEKRRRKDFFAAGWQNENGGWEVRSKNFTGCLGRKGMTFIPGDTGRLALFEDYISYLSWKYEHRTSGVSVLVMNGPEFLPAAKSRAAKFAEVTLPFGQEDAGEQSLSTV